MMNLHYDLAGRMLAGDDMIRNAPKVTSVLENARGNRMVPVVDVHEVRGMLYELNQLRPGELPRGWFRSDAWYRRYRDDPLNYDFSRGINDRLGYVSVNGAALPVEYAQVASILEDAAIAAGRDPAVAHRVGRELRAAETGFRSPGLTLEDTLNARLDRAVSILDEDPDRVFRWFIRNQIPLSVAGGTTVAGATLLDSTPSQAAIAPDPSAEQRRREVDELTQRLFAERSRRGPR